MKLNDLIRLCHEVDRASKINNWQFVGMPVIVWEFPTINEFVHAREELISAIVESKQFQHLAGDGYKRILGDDTTEVDCYGVTFRLVCKARAYRPDGRGSYGATDV